MTAVGRPDPGGLDLLALPDVTTDPLLLRDVEAFLLGLLRDEHVLGGPVRPGRPGPFAVLLGVDTPGNGVLFRDEEHTPIAALTGLVPVDGPGVRGRLVPVRQRESGHRAELALSRDDMSSQSPRGSQAVLVLDRPPTAADAALFKEVMDRSSSVWVIVPDAPGSVLPLMTLMATAEAWLSSIGAVASQSEVGNYAVPDGPRIRLRSAPLGWRDPTSDAALVTSLAAALRAANVHWLRASDESAGSRQWQSILARLHQGTTERLDGIDDDVARILRRWRPTRSRRGLTVMFTGLSGSGKSTVARGVSEWLQTHTDRSITLLDGDVVRQMLSSGLGFDRVGRVSNVRRIGYVAAEVTRHGGTAICAPIAPYATTRAEVRAMVEAVGDFLLVHVSTPIEECERRDLKGLYAQARAGTIPEFTGVSDPYEEPDDAVVRLDTSLLDHADAVNAVISLLRDGGWLEGRSA